LDKIIPAIDTLEKRMGKSVREHLGFGDIENHRQIQSRTEEYFGELESPPLSIELCGRGILCLPTVITIGYFANGDFAPGKNVSIRNDGCFSVAEIYFDANSEW
jgi:hypothetical protein